MSAPTTPTIATVEHHPPLAMRKLRILISIIWIAFIFSALALSLGIYLSVLYYQTGNPPTGSDAPIIKYAGNWVSFVTIASASVALIFWITLLALSGTKRYVAVSDGMGLSRGLEGLQTYTVTQSPNPQQQTTSPTRLPFQTK